MTTHDSISKTDDVLHQLQESYPFSCLDSMASTPLTGASVPYNPLSHWGSIGSVRSSPYSMAYHSRTYPLPSEEIHASQVSYHNPRTKTYEDKMEKQRLEHFLFAGGLDQQKERLRRKLSEKLNPKPAAAEKAKSSKPANPVPEPPAISSSTASPSVSSQKGQKGKSKRRRRRKNNAKKSRSKQRPNRKKDKKTKASGHSGHPSSDRESQSNKSESPADQDQPSSSPYTSSSSKSPVDPVEPTLAGDDDLEHLVLSNSAHSSSLIETLERDMSEIADGDHSTERGSPSVTLAMTIEEAEDEDEENEAERPGNALNVHMLGVLEAQSKEIAALTDSVTALQATVARLEGRLHSVELMESERQCASDATAGHAAVRAWLRDEVGLEQYAYVLIDNGFEDLLSLRTLDMRILDSVSGIDKIGHKSRILYFVDRLKEAEELEESDLEATHQF